MESFLTAFKEIGWPADCGIAQHLWEVSQRVERTPGEQVMVAAFHAAWVAHLRAAADAEADAEADAIVENQYAGDLPEL